MNNNNTLGCLVTLVTHRAGGIPEWITGTGVLVVDQPEPYGNIAAISQ